MNSNLFKSLLEMVREGHAKRERRLAKAARRFAKAQKVVQAKRNKQPETAEEIRAWHQRERLRSSTFDGRKLRGSSKSKGGSCG